jgi:hypothetical protein
MSYHSRGPYASPELRMRRNLTANRSSHIAHLPALLTLPERNLLGNGIKPPRERSILPARTLAGR